MSADSLLKRYIYKVGGKIVTGPIILLTQALIPRGLGPVQYGQFTFLSNFFQQVVNFFELGTSLAYYTQLCKKPEERSIIRFYSGFIGLISVLLLVGVSTVCLLGYAPQVFPGQDVMYIYLAALFALLTWLSESVYKTVDAFGLTVKGEIIFVIHRVISLVLLGAMFFLQIITLELFFYYNFFILLLVILMWGFILKRRGVSLIRIPAISRSEFKEKVIYFWHYSSPLISYNIASLLVGVADTWVLLKVAGAVQQGFFGLAFRLSSISFLFTGAMTQLITREFSIAHEQNNVEKMRDLFSRFVPMLYFVVTFLSVFFCAHSETIAVLFGGKEFENAALPIAIMALYPIHQTYGQLSGSLLYATGQTKLYRNIGLAIMPLSLLLTYLLLAPTQYYGFGFGATGLAVKTWLIQFIGVNVQLYFNTRFLSINYSKLFVQQLLVIVLIFAIGYVSKLAGDTVQVSILYQFIISGVIYTICCALIVYFFPGVASITRVDITNFINKIRKRTNRP